MDAASAVRRHVWLSVNCSGLILLLSMRELTAQAPTPIQSVPSFSELRATTSEEKARAEYWEERMTYRRYLPGTLGGSLIISGYQAIPSDVGCSIFVIDTGGGPIEEQRAEFDRSRDKCRAEARERDRRANVCSKTAIVVGHVVSTRTLMGPKEDFLFTDYSIAVDRWVLARDPRLRTDQLTLSIPGGEVNVSGRPLLYPIVFPTPPRQNAAVFFLDSIPGGGAYVGEFHEIRDGRVDDSWETTSLDDFIARTRWAAESCSSR